jgi:hypothetical protein
MELRSVFSARRWASFVLAAVLGAAVPPVAAALEADEDPGELMGDLMFHADLMATLDTICPSRGPTRDWQSVVRQLPDDLKAPELRDLSRRLSADAAQSMVRGSGGCGTRQFQQVYAQTRNAYEALLEQWAQLSV